jgi:pimeloyl-[acyl-carrier protein] methyl ester esterase
MSPLSIEVTGNGPDVVLLHGWGLNLRIWDGLVQELRDRFRMITVDLPGHGRSLGSRPSTPAERAWLIHQTLAPVSNRYALLGWSLGGQIALDLAAAIPGQIERLVLVATTAKFVMGPDWPCGMRPATMVALAEKLQADCRQTVHDFLDLQARGSARGEHVREQLHNALSNHGEAQMEALALALDSLRHSDLRAALPYVRSPALVIAGQYDRITPSAASRALADALPDARYVEFARAAHAPFLSHRHEFAMLVEKFLRPRAGRPARRKLKTRRAARANPVRPVNTKAVRAVAQQGQADRRGGKAATRRGSGNATARSHKPGTRRHTPAAGRHKPVRNRKRT